MKKITTFFITSLIILFTTPKMYAQLSIGVGLSINIAPPALPVYEQPECPGEDYIWTPGYWAYTSGQGYYWVPGVWVLAPHPGYLWTPCYWGFEGGVYAFHSGYWGPHIGFYGGINYGFGYGGSGYYGGRWNGGHFVYNTAVTRVNVNIVHNTYVDRTVIVNNNIHTSFNGRGVVTATPRPEEQRAMAEHHIQATSVQVSHQQTASRDRNQFASVNHGRPAITAINKPGGTRITAQGHTAAAVAHSNAPARTAPAAHNNIAARVARQRPATAVNNTTAARSAARPAQPQHTAPFVHNNPQARPAAQPHTTQPHPQSVARNQPRPAPPRHR